MFERKLTDIFGLVLLGTGCSAPVPVAPAEAGAMDAGGEDASDAAIEAAIDAPACPAIDVTSAFDAQSCERFLRLPCALTTTRDPRGCYLATEDCARLCNDDWVLYCFAADTSCDSEGGIVDAGEVTIECSRCLGNPGRPPRGLERLAEPSSLAGWLARAASLEAASVWAFVRLERDLARLGAPASLVLGCRAAARDEVRHATMVARLARRHGVTPIAPRIAAAPSPSLDVLAADNAIEGCVNETFAALEAHHQSLFAPEPLRSVMRTIAKDETGHAALSWAIAKWANGLQRSAGRARTRRVRTAALDALVGSPECSFPGSGLPIDRRALAIRLRRQLVELAA